MARLRAENAPAVRRPPPSRARARLQPADLALKRAPRYQRLRRLSLALVWTGIVAGPLWQVARANLAWAGMAGHGRWASLLSGRPAGLASPLLGAPWTLRLGPVEFLDPLAAASLAVARGLAVPALLGVLPVLALMLGLGRFFCGWLCPYVPLLATSNALRALAARAGFRLPDVEIPRATARWTLLAVLVGSAIAGAPLVALVYPPAIIGREVARAIFTGSLGAGAGVVLAIFLFDTLVSRGGFCRSVCPGGSLFSLLSARSRIRVVREASACTDCTACDVVCNLGQKPMTDALDPGCERCGKCIAVCPTQALRFDLVELRTAPEQPKEKP